MCLLESCTAEERVLVRGTSQKGTHGGCVVRGQHSCLHSWQLADGAERWARVSG